MPGVVPAIGLTALLGTEEARMLGLLARRLARASLVLLWVLLCDIFGSLSGCDGITRRHHRSPTVAASPAGRDPDRA